MIFPVIHLNGSGKTNLIRGYEEAADALRKALDALQAMRPHPRDYYVSDRPSAFAEAVAEHDARSQAVFSVYKEIEALWVKVADER